MALAYPSPYAVGMSSLGFQQVYRLLNNLPDTCAERAFVPDADDRERGPVLTYESSRPISDFPVVAISIAYETEILGVFDLLARSGIPLLASQRSAADPWVVVGGPLTFSNPQPLAPFADVIVMGEAEELLEPLCEALFSGESRSGILRALASRPGFYIPSEHGDRLPTVARANDALLPAVSAVRTPQAVLSAMALVEVERGCSRGCAFCVMRRGADGMRLVACERVLAVIAADARRVGLVGAAVSDHPQLVTIVQALVDRGCEVGLSSLRADRLTPQLAALLVQAGAKTLTIAADGASERLRHEMGKHIETKHLMAVAGIARDLGLSQLKCYAMLGLPGESDADVDELAAMALDLARVAGRQTRVVLGVSTFVAKRGTPLAASPFAGVRMVHARVDRLRRAVLRRVELRADSTRWAWVEYLLAQGGAQAGIRALAAWQAGGDLPAFKTAFAGAQDDPNGWAAVPCTAC